ncbi:MAG: Gldg family protein [Clostridia bacterium]|nr:Gldg family protein [Clostridia bacterium]
MLAFYHKELKLSLNTWSGYLFLFATLLISGIFVVLFNLFMGYADIAYSLLYLAPVLLIILPFPVLVSANRDREGSREAFLLSLSPRSSSIILGRYFANLTLFLLPTAVLFLTPLLFSMFGEIVFSSAYVSLCGYVLFGAAVLAILQFLAELSPKKLISALLSFGGSAVLFVLQLLVSILDLPDVLDTLIFYFNPIGLFYSFSGGTLPIKSAVALVLYTAVFLWLHSLLLRYRKGELFVPAKKNLAAATLAGVILASVLLNTVVALLPEQMTSIDVSGSDTFEISGTTRDYLHTLDQDVTVYYLCAGGKPGTDSNLRSFVELFEEETERLKVQYVDTNTETELLKTYGAEDATDQSFLVLCNGRYRLLDNTVLYHYYNSELGFSFSPTQYSYCISSFLQYASTGSTNGLDTTAITYGQTLYYSTETVAYFDGDSILTNAIRYVADETLPTVYIVTGNGAAEPDASLQAYLIEYGYVLQTVESLEEIPDACDILMLHSPAEDLTDAEAEALSAYLAEGGKLFLTTSCLVTGLDNLMSVTEQFGLGMSNEKNLVCESDADYLLVSDENSYFYAHIDSNHSATPSNFTGVFVSLLSHEILVRETEGVTVSPWLYTSENGYLTLYGGEKQEDEKGRYVFGVTAEKGDSTLLWISSPDSISDTAYSLSTGGNFTLLLSAFSQMCDNSYEYLSIESRLMPSQNLTVTDGEIAILALLLVLLIPAAPLIVCGTKRYIRKKR